MTLADKKQTIDKYNEIRLSKRYEDGVLLELAFLRADVGKYNYFIGGQFHGKLDLATTYRLLLDSYDAGYKTVSMK